MTEFTNLRDLGFALATLFRFLGPKASISKADSVVSMRRGELQTPMTGASGPNSLITCRQAPQGIVGIGVGVYTTTARSFRSPADMAVKMADRSAQLHRPNEAFSILVPE